MYIEKYTKFKDNRYKIKFVDGTIITLYDDVIVKYNLLLKKELSNEEFNEIITYNDNLEAYYKSIKYITTKMRTKKEIEKYLSSLDYSSKIIDETIVRIEKECYLNNDTYVKAYINDQLNLTKNGPYKISKSLSELGIEDSIIHGHLNEINSAIWSERLKKYADKKISVKTNRSVKSKKENTINYLVDLGYEKKDVIDYLSEIKIENESTLIEKEGNKILMKLKRKYSGYELRRHAVLKMVQRGFEYEEINDFLEIHLK